MPEKYDFLRTFETVHSQITANYGQVVPYRTHFAGSYKCIACMDSLIRHGNKISDEKKYIYKNDKREFLIYR